MKLSNSRRLLAIGAAVLLMTAYQQSPKAAWACTTAASEGFVYSSNTGPTTVTVCAKSVTTSRTVSVPAKTPTTKAPAPKAPPAKVPVKATPKPTPKPAPNPVKTVSLLTPISKGVPIALQKPVSKPVVKPAPKPVVSVAAPKTPAKGAVDVSAVISTTTAGEVSFSPAPISVLATTTNPLVGQSVGFWVTATTHYKTGLLLGKVTDARFIPVRTSWATDLGHSGVGDSISIHFASSGSVEVIASVTYAVAYQITGTSGWVSSGEITVSDSLTVQVESLSEEDPEVSSGAKPPSAKVVRLVGSNCLARAADFGCST